MEMIGENNFLGMSEFNDNQGCEIFFLKIGENNDDSSLSGDAIVLTLGDRSSTNRDDYKIIVIDGAFASDADTILRHLALIKSKNKNGKIQIDLMVSSHSDQDHIVGLVKLVENDDVKVDKLWIHDRSRLSDVECSLDQANKLISIAKDKGIKREEPFTGLEYKFNDFKIEVLGPTKDYYNSLMDSEERDYVRGKGLNANILSRTVDIIKHTFETIFNNERLRDPSPNATTNSNNSSTILLVKANLQDMSLLALLTADAGVEALERIIPNLVEQKGWRDEHVKRFVQIPHHGSRRNVGPTILNALLGEKEYECKKGACFVSAHEKDESHPKVQVTNAFSRRGYDHFSNEKNAIRFPFGKVPDIVGWTSANSIGLENGEEVEDQE